MATSVQTHGVFLGVDVGTGSVRAVALDENGTSLASAVRDLDINRPKQDYYEQSSDQIWTATCDAIREVIKTIGDQAARVKGIGFDATCSLVVLDQQGHPLSVSSIDAITGARIWDVIMWMDHRAIDQADRINATKHSRLKHVGGQISPELELPKLLWLKEKKPEIWAQVGHLMDLTDFLTFRATGSLIRSQCTVVSKWLYEADANGGRWDPEFWNAIGLSELANSPKVGSEIRIPGSHCGVLTPEVATQFGLPTTTTIAVAVGVIDAHAGVLGVFGTRTPDRPDLDKADIEEKIAIIAGTSACHMVVSKEAHFVKGVWGPNFGVIFGGYWLNEAGQNALGPVLDEVATEGDQQKRLLSENHRRIINELHAYEVKHGHLATAALTKDLHVWPDYRGNRSPLADPHCKGLIAGLRLKADIDQHEISSAAVRYLAHVQALAYMSRYIMETVARYSGPQRKPFTVIYLCGGLQKNPIYVQAHADICHLSLVVPSDSEVVARGAAVFGACASGVFASMDDAMRALSCSGVVVTPNADTYDFHEKKYQAFLLLGKTEWEVRRIMAGHS